MYYKCAKFHKNPISRLGGVALTRYIDGRGDSYIPPQTLFAGGIINVSKSSSVQAQDTSNPSRLSPSDYKLFFRNNVCFFSNSYVAYILMLYKQVQYECLWSNTGKSYSAQASWFFIHYWKSVISNTYQFRDDSESKSAINKTFCGYRLHWFKKTVQKDQEGSVVF